MKRFTFGLSCLIAFSVVSAQPAADPLVMVFDLNGDGLSFTTVEQGVSFDIDGSGTPRQTPWTLKGSDDAFLAVDNNKNGKIDSASELVGNRLILDNGARARTGMEVLQFHLQGYAVGPDGRRVDPSMPPPKGAGYVDASDPGFSRLRLWNDADHDGLTDPGELKTLSERDVKDIMCAFRSWVSIDKAPLDAQGNRRVTTGTFHVEKEGTQFTRELVEIAFAR